MQSFYGELAAICARRSRELSAGVLGAILALALDAQFLGWIASLGWFGKLLIGFLLGFFSVSIIRWLRSTVEPYGLEQIEVDLPLLGPVSIALADPQREEAWRLFVELSSRVATQSLYEPKHAELEGRAASGRLSLAIESVYSTFATCRDELKQTKPTPLVLRARNRLTLEAYVLGILNNGLRPFLSRWHPRLDAWTAAGHAEEDWPLADLCRRDLEATRIKVAEYTRGLGLICGLSQADLEVLVPLPSAERVEELAPIQDIRLVEADLPPLLANEICQGYRELVLQLATLLPHPPPDPNLAQARAGLEAFNAMREAIREQLPQLPLLPAGPRSLDKLVLLLCQQHLRTLLDAWLTSEELGSEGIENGTVGVTERARAFSQDVVACTQAVSELLDEMLARVA